jgi:hypothetical protein
MRQKLTVFEDDGVTPAAVFSTDATDERPYLKVVELADEQRIDLLEGTATIGQLNVQVVDVRQDPEDQASGFLTSILADSDGESARLGRLALMEREVAPEEWRSRFYIVDSLELLDTLVTYLLILQDVRSRERDVRLFTRSRTTALLPLGHVIGGYGGVVPDALEHPVRATARDKGTYVEAVLDEPLPLPDADVEAAVAAKPRYEADTGSFVGFFVEDATVLWRPLGGSYVVLEGVEAVWMADGQPASLFGTTQDVPAGERQERGERWRVFLAGGAVPNDEQEIEIVVRYDGEPTERFPFHFQGTSGQLLKEILEGEHSDEPLDEPFNEAVIGALVEETHDTLLRLLEPVENAFEWIPVNIHVPEGMAPALDDEGKLAPIRYRIPDEIPALRFTDDNVSREGTGWSHDGAEAVSEIIFRYWRDYPSAASEAADGLTSRRVEHVFRGGHKGGRRLVYEPDTFRAVGGVSGGSFGGDVMRETAARVAQERARQAFDRQRFGAQLMELRGLTSSADVRDAKVGDWVRIEVSWLPDYRTGKRGMDRIGQIIHTGAETGSHRDFLVLDAGHRLQILDPLTLGDLTAASDGRVTLVIDAIPTDLEAEVHYAIAETEPDENSGKWTHMGRRHHVTGRLPLARYPALGVGPSPHPDPGVGGQRLAHDVARVRAPADGDARRRQGHAHGLSLGLYGRLRPVVQTKIKSIRRRLESRTQMPLRPVDPSH